MHGRRRKTYSSRFRVQGSTFNVLRRGTGNLERGTLNLVGAKENGMRLKHAIISIIAVTALLATSVSSFAAAVCGKPEKSDVVVTYAQTSGAFTPMWLAYEAGLFKKYGLNAKLQLLTPQVSAQAVIAEEADFYTDGPDLINARLHGGRVKYFAGTIQQFVFQMWAAKEITTMDQLKDKSVAASTPRAALDTATREALKKNGLVPEDRKSTRLNS